MDLVSVIMPYYKKRNYIKHSIYSVLRQSYQRFEIIIVYDDDNKNDVSFIENIKKMDRRIQVIYNKKNVGPGFSRNIGIDCAKGNMIAFLDCDDIWYKNKLDLQLKFMRKKKADFSFTSYYLIDNYNQLKGKRSAKPILDLDILLKSCDIGLSTVIMKKKLFNSYYKFPKLKTKEDFVLWLKLAKKKVLLHGLNQYLTKWRITANSSSSNNFQKILDAFTVYKKYIKFNILKSLYYVFILSINFIIKKYL